MGVSTGQPTGSADGRCWFRDGSTHADMATHPLLYTVGQAVDRLPQVSSSTSSWPSPTAVYAPGTSGGRRIAYLAASSPSSSAWPSETMVRTTCSGGANRPLRRGPWLPADRLATCCVVGVVMLLVRSHAQGRPVRLAMGLVVQGFALALLLIAALDVLLVWVAGRVSPCRSCVDASSSRSGWPRRPARGLLQVRLARVAVDDLVMQLTPTRCHRLCGRSRRGVADPTLQACTRSGVPPLGGWRRPGRQLPEPVDRPRRRRSTATAIGRALVHHRRCWRSRAP